jgi:hypothetical protein
VVDEQFGAAAAALAAQQGESGETLGTVHDQPPFLGSYQLSVT